MLAEKIENDLKEALKLGDTLKLSTLRMLKAALSNYLIEKKKKSADDAEIQTLIQKQIKMRDDAIEGCKKAGRQDLLDKETREKSILQSYVPKPLSPQELEGVVRSVISEKGAKSRADIGLVMKEALSRCAGRADGKAVQAAALKLLP